MQGDTKNHFWVFGMTRPRIEPQSLGPLVNTLPTKILLIELIKQLNYSIENNIFLI